jgi:hypothetical protein
VLRGFEGIHEKKVLTKIITKYLLPTLGARHSSFHFDIPNLLSFTFPCLPLATNVYIAVVLTIHQIFQQIIPRVRIFTYYAAFDTYHSKFNSRFAMAGDTLPSSPFGIETGHQVSFCLLVLTTDVRVLFLILLFTFLCN